MISPTDQRSHQKMKMSKSITKSLQISETIESNFVSLTLLYMCSYLCTRSDRRPPEQDSSDDEDTSDASDGDELDPQMLLGTSQQDNQEEDEHSTSEEMIEEQEGAQISEISSVPAPSSELFLPITNDIDTDTSTQETRSIHPRSSLLSHLEAMNGDYFQSNTMYPTSQKPEDLRWGSNPSTSRTKRVLSSTTLSAITASSTVGHKGDSPKRMRAADGTAKVSPILPEFSLGVSALDQSTEHSLRVDDSKEAESSSDEDEEALDQRLSEELGQAETPLAGYSSDPSISCSRGNSPVPLLTPPQSPLTIDVGDGGTQMCEWPSNLVVDTSLLSVLSSGIRPLSPGSLTKFEAEEEEHISGHLKAKGSTAAPSTSLTPMLRSINVGVE